jgi:ATP-dependent DNA helicase RecG
MWLRPSARWRHLTEAGFVEAHGATRGRTYMLSAAVYGAVADKAAYTRQAGFAPIQHEQMVLSYVRQHGRIKRAEAMELCRLSEGQVKNLLKRMCKAGLLVLEGAGPAAHYRIGSSDRVVSDEIG